MHFLYPHLHYLILGNNVLHFLKFLCLAYCLTPSPPLCPRVRLFWTLLDFSSVLNVCYLSWAGPSSSGTSYFDSANIHLPKDGYRETTTSNLAGQLLMRSPGDLRAHPATRRWPFFPAALVILIVTSIRIITKTADAIQHLKCAGCCISCVFASTH